MHLYDGASGVVTLMRSSPGAPRQEHSPRSASTRRVFKALSHVGISKKVHIEGDPKPVR